MIIGILLTNLLLGIVLISTLIALILFVVSAVLFLKKNKTPYSGKFPTRRKIAVILFAAALVFLMPLTITLFIDAAASEIKRAKQQQYIESIENKVYVQENEWIKGFSYEEKELIPVNILMEDDLFDLEYLGALISEASDKYITRSFYRVLNDSGYDIYYVKVTAFAGGTYYSRTFVDKKDYDAVVNYYDNSNLTVSTLWKTAPDAVLRGTGKTLKLRPDDKQAALMALSHEILDNIGDKKVSGTSPREDYENIIFWFHSADGVYRTELCIYTKGEEMILFLNGYEVEREIVETYKEMLFDLAADAQAELLQKTEETF